MYFITIPLNHSSAIYLSINSESFLAPSVHYTTRNVTTTFYCDSVGTNAYWEINSSAVDGEGRVPWTDMGFMFVKNVIYDPMGNEHVHHNILLVPAYREYNNTIITCAVLDRYHRLTKSNPIKIIVIGMFF